MSKQSSHFHLRQDSSADKRGFTIVELVIVIVVIGILAGIIIIGYGAWKKTTTESTMKSDLNHAATSVAAYRTWKNSLPTDGGQVNDGQGIKASGSNVLTYYVKPYGYCVTASNTITTTKYRIASDDASETVSEGTCDGPTITTFAGSGADGYANSPTAATASFGYPCGIAADSANNLYVSDCWYHQIRKITPAGVVSTLAGSSTGASGAANGNGSAASFKWPHGIAVDNQGTVYVADTSNNKIRKITPTGDVSVFAGTGVAGSADGAGLTTAQFNSPIGLAVDSSRNVYVADYLNNKIRKIAPDGTVSTLAGSGTKGTVDGTGSAAQFIYPVGVVVDSSGTLYVTAEYDYRIRKVSSSGVVTTFVGSGQNARKDGQGLKASLTEASLAHLAISPSGTLYFPDTNWYSTNYIRKVTPGGYVSTIAGSDNGDFQDGTDATARFNEISGLVVGTDGAVYVADGSNHRIRKMAW